MGHAFQRHNGSKSTGITARPAERHMGKAWRGKNYAARHERSLARASGGSSCSRAAARYVWNAALDGNQRRPRATRRGLALSAPPHAGTGAGAGARSTAALAPAPTGQRMFQHT